MKNNLLIKKLAEASDTILELQSNNKESTSKLIKQQIVKPFKVESFNILSKKYLLELEAKKNAISIKFRETQNQSCH